MTSPFVDGQTGIVAAVPGLEPYVGHWRRRFDPAAALGVPPHVTVTFPFLPLPELTEAALVDLDRIVADREAFDVTFEACGRFPTVLYLQPEPGDRFRELTGDLLRRWPQAPPYGGEFGDEPTPHLTVTSDAGDAAMTEAEQAVTSSLPLTFPIDGLLMLAFDGRRWNHHRAIPLATRTRVARAGQ